MKLVIGMEMGFNRYRFLYRGGIITAFLQIKMIIGMEFELINTCLFTLERDLERQETFRIWFFNDHFECHLLVCVLVFIVPKQMRFRVGRLPLRDIWDMSETWETWVTWVKHKRHEWDMFSYQHWKNVVRVRRAVGWRKAFVPPPTNDLRQHMTSRAPMSFG